MTQTVSTFKSFLRNWINPGRSNPKQKTRKKAIVNNAASKLLNGKMEKLEDEYNWLSKVENKYFHARDNIENLFLKDFNYDDWFVRPLEGD